MTPLRQRMLEDMQVRNLSPLTQRSYVEHVSRFARHFGRSPALLGPEEIRAYQVYVTNVKHLSPASMVVTVAALRFLYTVTLQKTWAVEAVIPAPKVPQTLPVVLSPAEVVRCRDARRSRRRCRARRRVPVAAVAAGAARRRVLGPSARTTIDPASACGAPYATRASMWTLCRTHRPPVRERNPCRFSSSATARNV